MDPWSVESIDLEQLKNKFGLKDTDDELKNKLGRDEFLVERNLLVAHRGLDIYLDEIERGKKSAILSGIKPSGRLHIGNLTTLRELVFFQKKFGVKLFCVIADIEAYNDNGLPYKQSKKNAIYNIADLLALGLDINNSYIYRQSSERRILELAGIFSRHITKSTLEAVYGEQNMGRYFSAIIQMADIYLPQHEDFGYENVLVPVGLDQDPHIRLARDLSKKDLAITIKAPKATYHRTIQSLNGNSKMSKRDQTSMVTLYEDEKSIDLKLKKALTGGRDTIEEQRKLGGRPNICPVFKLWRDWLNNVTKEEIKERFERCVSGRLSCGVCKKEIKEKMIEWLKEHEEKRKSVMDIAEKIVEGKY